MGGLFSRDRRVVPGDTTTISVAPAPASSSDSSQQNLNSSFGRRGSARGISRPTSQLSRTGTGRLPSGVRRRGSHPPGSLSNSFNMRGEKLSDRLFQPTRVDPFTPSDLAFSLSQTGQHQRQLSFNSEEMEGDAFILRVHPAAQASDGTLRLITCPSCHSKFSSIVHVPLLLLCGHTYCSSCIDKALNRDPSYLRCGVCQIYTPIDPQTQLEDFRRNKPVLDLLECKDFSSVVASAKVDMCAECEKEPAALYCSECSASYCDYCNRQQHTNSKVRSKHKPVSINLKPRPQPTCRKHPGQSCVLYCETERQPMCVLCKFYGQHRFHSYQLLSNVAAAYKTTLTKKLSQVDDMEKILSEVALSQADTVVEIRNKAMEAQDKLEKQFADARQELIAALEQKEAVLLCLLDKQVETREQILLEQRMEVAAARARTLAAKEEASKLLGLNPVAALLARKHIDVSMDKVLKQTTTFSHVQLQKDGGKERESISQLLPIGLRKGELTTRLHQVLTHYGAVLQLPQKPVFTEAKVHQNAISLYWELPGQTEVTTDRTRVYVLQCFADAPFKYKHERMLQLKKRFLSVPSGVSPESGFDEPSDVSSQNSEAPRSTLPSIPPSLLCSQNISLVTMNSTAAAAGKGEEDQQLNSDLVQEEEGGRRPSRKESEGGAGFGPKPGQRAPRMMKPIFPEPVHIPHGTEGVPAKKQPHQLHRDPTTQASAALLSLPPLLTKTSEEGRTNNVCKDDVSAASDSNPDLFSDSNMSGILGDVEDTPRHPPPKTILEQGQAVSTDSTSTLSVSSSDSAEEFTVVGRFCEGYAFEEMYSGPLCRFCYSGVIPGVTYFFRVLCHNAAGDGPWSNTIKCSVPTGRK